MSGIYFGRQKQEPGAFIKRRVDDGTPYPNSIDGKHPYGWTCGEKAVGFRNLQHFDETWSGVSFRSNAAKCADIDGPAWKIKLPERALYRVEIWFNSAHKLKLGGKCFATADGHRKTFGELNASVEYFQDDDDGGDPQEAYSTMATQDVSNKKFEEHDEDDDIIHVHRDEKGVRTIEHAKNEVTAASPAPAAAGSNDDDDTTTISIPVVKVRFEVQVSKKKYFFLQGSECANIMKIAFRKVDPNFC